jgi:hypothetical protein
VARIAAVIVTMVVLGGNRSTTVGVPRKDITRLAMSLAGHRHHLPSFETTLALAGTACKLAPARKHVRSAAWTTLPWPARFHPDRRRRDQAT